MTLLDTLVLAVAELIMYVLGIVIAVTVILISLAAVILCIIWIKDVINF